MNNTIKLINLLQNLSISMSEKCKEFNKDDINHNKFIHYKDTTIGIRYYGSTKNIAVRFYDKDSIRVINTSHILTERNLIFSLGNMDYGNIPTEDFNDLSIMDDTQVALTYGRNALVDSDFLEAVSKFNE